MMRPIRRLCRALPAALLSAGMLAGADSPAALHDEREAHLADVRQLTSGGENAEAYFSPDGSELIFQSTRAPYRCDQIFRMPIDDPEALSLVSTGRGRTTCGFFSADGERVIYSSTHAAGPQCPAPPDRSRGYVWPLYDSYQIYSAAPDGADVVPLTDTAAYDAEATVCPVDGSIVFTSSRDGDLELYRMNADGSNVERLTEAPGYDGGAFFSRDCSKIVWRASRPTGERLAEYRALLADGLIRPGQLELWVANADGSDARQVTYLGGANFAPYFFPDGERIIFSSNHDDPSGREFDLWAINVDGSGLERITYTPGFDGFPMFSPDGSRLVFASNRNQAGPGETDVYLARWVDAERDVVAGPADRYLADVAWLAAGQRDGRGIGTEGLEASARWLVEQFRHIGLEPGTADGYRQHFDAVVDVELDERTSLALNDVPLPAADYAVPGFSASGRVSAPVVFAEWGIVSPEHGIDNYAGLDVEGRIVLVRRYTPTNGVFENEAMQRRFGSLRYKAFTAREQGAAGLLIADLPPGTEQPVPEEPPLPVLRADPQGDAGIPVAVLKRRHARPLLGGDHRATLTAELIEHTRSIANVVGRLPASGPRKPGAVLLGAHYDHLGLGGPGSLAPDENAPHNGADDNASGTAALLEAARLLARRSNELERDVLFVAFTGEERGLLGSSHFTRSPPGGVDIDRIVAMLNLDMVGRLRNNRLVALGTESAEEWDAVLPPICAGHGIDCRLGGDGYGPSDQTPFYAAGVPVLHLFTGTHDDYHRPSDDWQKINAAGGARVAALVADLVQTLSVRQALTYQAAEAPAPRGDVRSYGASLGTIPDYAGLPGDRRGMALAGVRPGGPADRAGLGRGDVIVELAGREVRDIYDLMYILRQAQPGDESTVVVERDGMRIERPITFGQSTGR